MSFRPTRSASPLLLLAACCVAGDDAWDDRPPFVPPAAPVPDEAGLPPLVREEVGPKLPNYLPGAEWGAQGERLSEMQRPLPPTESLKRLVVPEGFHVELFAAEPDLGGKPVAVNWDDAGRLWVCETVDYPNELRPPGEGRDRVRICEDVDRDGTADRFTVFAEHLSIPTAVLPLRNGAVVQDGTRTLFLADTDGDGRSDRETVLLTGWSLGDTHGGVSNLRPGLDNWVWGMQGYNRSTPTAPGLEPQTFNMGFFRFRLDWDGEGATQTPWVAEFELVRSTNNNTWGLGISEEGLIFGSTANGNPSVYMPIANRYYERVRGWGVERLGTIAENHLFAPITDRVRQVDWHGGYTAGAGHALYTARRFPRQWWNRTAFVCGPTGHLVGTFVLERDGSDFHSRSPLNLLASTDEWTAPVAAEVGPDGAVWVVDWYNYIVQHNPTPQGFETGKGQAYETDLRDKTHGRVYRVVPDGTESAPWPDLKNATPAELVAALRHPNMYWRLRAQWALIDREREASRMLQASGTLGHAEVVPALLDLLRDRSTDEIGLNVGAIHALHVLDGLGLTEAPTDEVRIPLFWDGLKHPSAGVRMNAVRVLPRSADGVTMLLEAGVLEDADALVRLNAALTLADVPGDNLAAGAALADALAEPRNMNDRWLPDALTAAGANHPVHFLQVATAAELPPRATEVVRTVAEHLARSRDEETVLAVLPWLSAGPHEQAVTAAILDGFTRGWPDGRPPGLTKKEVAAFHRLADGLPDDAAATAVRLARRWNLDGFDDIADRLTAAALAVATDEGLEPDDRLTAARRAVALDPNDADTVNTLLDAVDARTPPAVAAGLLAAAGESRASTLGEEITARFAGFGPSARIAAVGVLLGRPGLTGDLLAAVEAGDVSLTDLPPDRRQALAEHPDPVLRARAVVLLERGGGLPNPDRQKVIDAYLADDTVGNREPGAAVFKQHCAKCHRFAGEGGAVGPDLTGMASHPRAELLIHILDPSRSVEGNFRTWTLLTADGRVSTGLLGNETRTAVTLIDAEGKPVTVLRDEIEQLVGADRSLMPDGFEKLIDPAGMADLIAYLQDAGGR